MPQVNTGSRPAVITGPGQSGGATLGAVASAAAAAAKALSKAATVAPGKTSSSKSGSSKSSKSSGGSGSGGAAAAKSAQQAAALAQLLELLQGRLDAELNAAQSWYDRQSESVKSLYAGLEANIAKGHKLTLANLDAQYKAGVNETNRSIDSKLTEAYVNKMMSERNLGQKLAAMGITGGAAESALLSMANSYGNSRNKLETSRAASLASQLQSYQSSKSTAQQSYSQSLSGSQIKQAQALMGLDTNYAGMIAKAQNAYNASRASALMKLI